MIQNMIQCRFHIAAHIMQEHTSTAKWMCSDTVSRPSFDKIWFALHIVEYTMSPLTRTVGTRLTKPKPSAKQSLVETL